MMINKILATCGLILIAHMSFLTTVYGQGTEKQYAYETFRGTRVINGQSVEMRRGGEMEMIINHRFGRINGGAYEFFGLDEANIRIGLDYGVTDWLTVGGGRSSLGKEFDSFVKVKLLSQSTGGKGAMPLSATFYSSVAYNSLRDSDPLRPVLQQHRFSYVSQLLLARKFSDRFSLQLAPTYVHFNIVNTQDESNDKIALGAAGKYQLSKNWALTSEYYYTLPAYQQADRTNALSIGFDLNTGSHVFQFHFTNSTAMIDKQFIGETTGNWLDGDIHLGFNIVRTFKLKGRRY